MLVILMDVSMPKYDMSSTRKDCTALLKRFQELDARVAASEFPCAVS